MWNVLHQASWLLGLVANPIPAPLDNSPGAGPHSYVGPIANGGSWTNGFKLASAAVSNMTLEEKVRDEVLCCAMDLLAGTNGVLVGVNLTSSISGPCPSNSGGVPRLGIPGMCFDDGPAGPRYTDFITQFPSESTAAASWDRQLISERAKRIGEEFRGKGISVALAPVTGGPLGRSPFAGRNWEAFSPDPYLSSTLSGLTVRGMQASGVITCAKHYILYEQEPVCKEPLDTEHRGERTDCRQVSEEADEKTLKELYLPSFAEAVRAGTGAVMCSYNLINGTAACENDRVMNQILKTELNFQGFVLSDYGATHSTIPSALAGLDMELPSVAYYGKHLLKAAQKGKIPMERIDDMARRILTPWYASKQNDGYPKTNWNKHNLADVVQVDGHTYYNEHIDVRGENHLLARKIAAESTVLLKNQDSLLPLNSSIRRIGIFGSDAGPPSTLSGCGPDLFCMVASKRRYWNGTVTIGGGSGATYADYVVSPLEAISSRARSERMRVDHVLQDDSAHFEAINAVAAASEVCMVFVSVYLVEGWDRKALRLDRNGEELIKEVEKGCAGRVVVVVHSGGPVVMEDWIDLPKISAVLWAGYPGQESGNALVDILWGDVNPSAKLPCTLGKEVSDWPTGNIIRESEGMDVTYPRAIFSEGLAIDYKWSDEWGIEPRFEFGFGMSYTRFRLAGLEVTETYQAVRDTVQPTNERFEGDFDLYDVLWKVRVNVTNTGSIPGAEVAQLYASFPPSEKNQPPKHLKGFEKVFLGAGQSATATFLLRKKDLSVWDVGRQLWRVPMGEFTFHVGTSSRNLPLVKHLVVGEIR